MIKEIEFWRTTMILEQLTNYRRTWKSSNERLTGRQAGEKDWMRWTNWGTGIQPLPLNCFSMFWKMIKCFKCAKPHITSWSSWMKMYKCLPKTKASCLKVLTKFCYGLKKPSWRSHIRAIQGKTAKDTSGYLWYLRGRQRCWVRLLAPWHLGVTR